MAPRKLTQKIETSAFDMEDMVPEVTLSRSKKTEPNEFYEKDIEDIMHEYTTDKPVEGSEVELPADESDDTIVRRYKYVNNKWMYLDTFDTKLEDKIEDKPAIKDGATQEKKKTKALKKKDIYILLQRALVALDASNIDVVKQIIKEVVGKTCRRKREPSAYNIFLKEHLAELKISRPTAKPQDRMKEAIAQWRLLHKKDANAMITASPHNTTVSMEEF